MLTVFEALLFAARLRLPENVPDLEKQARVNSIMEKLGISSLRDVKIGNSGSGGGRGISGGEMRRVSIGLELIARPDVLILDEPTSGSFLASWTLRSSLEVISQDWIPCLPLKWQVFYMPLLTMRRTLQLSLLPSTNLGKPFFIWHIPFKLTWHVFQLSSLPHI
jgi:hypothetical protein